MTRQVTRFLAAAVQYQAELYRPDANRMAAGNAIRAAAQQGARLVVLPELCISGYGLDPEGLSRSAEPSNGPTVQEWQKLSRELGITICGGFCETNEERLFNSAVLITPDGAVTLYRKLHLFDTEKEVFAPGDLGLPIADTPIGRIGICVCYDLRFVEVARCFALEGVDLLAVPTAWVGGFDPNAHDAMGFIGQARGAIVQANLNQIGMVCASQSGRRKDVRFLGNSLIVDSFGTCLAGPAAESEAVALLAELDLADIRASRVRGERIRPREDRRTDVYDIRLVPKTKDET